MYGTTTVNDLRVTGKIYLNDIMLTQCGLTAEEPCVVLTSQSEQNPVIVYDVSSVLFNGIVLLCLFFGGLAFYYKSKNK